MAKRKLLNTALEHLEKGEWQAAHEIVQNEESLTACWAHGIVHLMEGDRSNARYWYRQAKRPFPSEPSARKEIESLQKELSRG